MKREIKIGLTGIVALVILFVGINFLKGVKLFDTSKSYYIVFKNAKGLTKSSTVYADGFNIGIVDNVTYARPGEVVVRINVGGNVKIPHGTIANLDEAMLGGCTLNLIMGANPADCFMPAIRKPLLHISPVHCSAYAPAMLTIISKSRLHHSAHTGVRHCRSGCFLYFSYHCFGCKKC